MRRQIAPMFRSPMKTLLKSSVSPVRSNLHALTSERRMRKLIRFAAFERVMADVRLQKGRFSGEVCTLYLCF